MTGSAGAETVTVTSPEQMERLGAQFGVALLGVLVEPDAVAGATREWPGLILGLEGDLGAGKTTFVRGLVRGVTGVDRVVTSPTFQLMNLYRASDAGASTAKASGGLQPGNLAHIDAYRLTGPQDFWELGIADLLADRFIVAVEWPSRTRHPIFDADAVHLQFSHVDESTRRLSILRQPSGLRLAL